MKVLFLSLVQIHDLRDRGSYTDLLRQFVKNGHFVRVISPSQSGATEDIVKDGYAILKVRSPQMQKVAGFIRKGIASLRIGPIMRRALAKYCARERYDLILVATPPITIAETVGWVKRRDGAKVYLLLKDIWPQGIADLGVISQSGLIYRYYRFKERKLYALADRIGCMSPANVDYLLKHNPEIWPEKIDLCPNSIEPLQTSAAVENRAVQREKYHIPQDKTVFIYGGNLGRPQGIPFIINALRACSKKGNCFFAICGTGTEYPSLKDYVETEKPRNVLLINGLPQEEYEALVEACDVGLLFLDYCFTIPNFPSRLLAYMQAGLPVLSCTDPNTDVGDTIEAGGFGWKCYSNDVDRFCLAVDTACKADLAEMGAAGRAYLSAHYTAEQSYQIIMETKEGSTHVSG